LLDKKECENQFSYPFFCFSLNNLQILILLIVIEVMPKYRGKSVGDITLNKDFVQKHVRQTAKREYKR
jgi:hypothetical protein